ncbi:Rieske 2Fe-2S domain-containing protein [Zavarzinia aquatilis]|uniref:2Fe-2S ferredoxin n=1 Tax=Zavarzinia aquatilis TaxID=2211142 RepID=A0A317DYS6_9PROT|nr:Rieske 2Fe-2S domain-containing protein [Zavarzinia aquatilis]PWR19504.1 2Fe-2S ferredoxin [Zavarzinia aquatilis]
MSFRPICTLDDLWEGEMQVFEVGGREVLMVNAEGGIVRAFDPICPHQERELIDGTLDGRILTCPAHLWQFDIDSGEGVNPTGCRLTAYQVRIEADQVLVDLPD